MIPDPFARTVVLPVRVRAGVVEFFYGGPLPALNDDAIGDLVGPAMALKDQQLLGPLSNHLDVPILPSGTHLLAGLRPEAECPELPSQYRSDVLLHGFSAYAEIILQQPLELRFRGTKRATLKSCECLVPAVAKMGGASKGSIADSINHAYSILSTLFETRRRAHTGNVFQIVFYRSAKADGRRVWEPLEVLRQRLEA
ncbi:MAG: hypothetical protein ABI586_07135, partial [Candidatus Nanopelagicales bacterium]